MTQFRTPLFDLDNCDMFIFSRRRRLVQTKPIFFYHIPKTGGVMLRTALTAALEMINGPLVERKLRAESNRLRRLIASV